MSCMCVVCEGCDVCVYGVRDVMKTTGYTMSSISPALANRYAANYQFPEAVAKFTEAINMYPLDHRWVCQ